MQSQVYNVSGTFLGLGYRVYFLILRRGVYVGAAIARATARDHSQVRCMEATCTAAWTQTRRLAASCASHAPREEPEKHYDELRNCRENMCAVLYKQEPSGGHPCNHGSFVASASKTRITL